MTTKIWRGDAPAVAQVTRLTPAIVEIGDTFSVNINGKSETVTATAATVANVVALLVASINASNIPELQEVSAAADGSTSVLLTARTAGIPFTVTTSASNGGVPGVVVTTTVQGSAVGGSSNQTQTFRVPLTAAGTFTVSIGGYVTTAIAIGAAAATVQAAIEALTSIGAGNASVALTADANDSIYTMTVIGAKAGTNVGQLFATITSTKIIVRTLQDGDATHNELQELTYSEGTMAAGTTFTLTHNVGWTTAALDWSDKTNVAPALSALGNIDYVNDGVVGNKLTIEFAGANGLANENKLVASTLSGGGTITVTVYPVVVAAVAASGAVNEIQVVTLSPVPSGGTFPLTLGASTTASIAYNASAATVQAALEGLASIGVGNATVTGSAGGPWTVTFVVGKAATNMSQMTGDGASLTASATESFTASTVTASTGPNHYDESKNWSPVGVPITGDAVIFEDTGDDCLYGLSQAGVTLASLSISMAWQNRKLGLPHINQTGYREYREQQLTIGCTSVVIGTQDGTGPSRVYLDTGTVQTALSILNSGSSSDAFPAVIWIGDNVLNTIVIDEGEFGTSPFADVVARFSSLVMYGGRCTLKNATIVDSLQSFGNPIRAFGCTLGGKVLDV